MNFTYDGADLSSTIKHYKINENKIIIKYLDGSTKIVENSKNMENLIQEEMLEQAKERNVRMYYYEIENPLDSDFIFLSWLLLGSNFALNHLPKIPYHYDISNLITGGLGCVILGQVVSELKHYKQCNELTKYDYYLCFKNELEKYKNYSELYDNVRNNNELNINTLDSYSEKDLDRVIINLCRIIEEELEKENYERTKKLR